MSTPPSRSYKITAFPLN